MSSFVEHCHFICISEKKRGNNFLTVFVNNKLQRVELAKSDFDNTHKFSIFDKFESNLSHSSD